MEPSEQSPQFFWRDVKSFIDLKQALDIERAAKMSNGFTQDEIMDLLNILCMVDYKADGNISLKDVR